MGFSARGGRRGKLARLRGEIGRPDDERVSDDD